MRTWPCQAKIRDIRDAEQSFLVKKRRAEGAGCTRWVLEKGWAERQEPMSIVKSLILTSAIRLSTNPRRFAAFTMALLHSDPPS